MTEPAVTIRPGEPGDAAAIAEVHVQAWRETYAGLMPATVLDNLDVGQRRKRWKARLTAAEPRYSNLVASTAEGAIIGFADGGPRRHETFDYDGELYALYLLAAYQGRGIGRALFTRLVAELRHRDMASMYLWVLADSPTTGFYEHMGGTPLGRDTLEFGGVALKDVAYGWPDLEVVANSAATA